MPRHRERRMTFNMLQRKSKRARTESVESISLLSENLDIAVKERVILKRALDGARECEERARNELYMAGGVELDSLLVLSVDILCIILSFLDTKSISVWSQVCSVLNALVDNAYEKMEAEMVLNIKQVGKSEAKNAKTRMLRFESAARFSKRIEKLSFNHRSLDHSNGYYSLCEELKIGFCMDCKSFPRHLNTDIFWKSLQDYEVFIRFSLRHGNSFTEEILIFQGFVKRLKRWSENDSDGRREFLSFPISECQLNEGFSGGCNLALTVISLNIEENKLSLVYSSDTFLRNSQFLRRGRLIRQNLFKLKPMNVETHSRDRNVANVEAFLKPFDLITLLWHVNK